MIMKKIKFNEQMNIRKQTPNLFSLVTGTKVPKKKKDADASYGFPLFCNKEDIISLGVDNKVNVADIWMFWDFVIKSKQANKETHNQSQQMLSLLEQAKCFYQSAESSPVNAKPLLYYYSFLNLAKIMLNISNGNNFGFGAKTQYQHGVSANYKSFAESYIKLGNSDGNNIAVSAELLKLMEEKTASKTINIQELLANCIGVHSSYSQVYNKEETFFELLNYSLLKKGNKLRFTAEVQCPTDKTLEETKAGLEKFYPNLSIENKKLYWTVAVNIFSEFAENKFTYVQLSNRDKLLNMSMIRISDERQNYHKLAKKLKEQGIWYSVGDNGYNCYISSNPNCRYQPEFIIYNTMFYLGAIARYQPYMFAEIFNDKEQWLMSEFLTTQPKQFLYLATAKVLGCDIRKRV